MTRLWYWLKNSYLVFVDQLPVSRMFRNLRAGHILGLFHENSHAKNGKPKVMYNTKATAKKSAAAMGAKTGAHFSSYKCVWCEGYHIGKNRTNSDPQR